MDSVEFNNKIGIATKWSSITEILARMIAPITTMILARLLAPEAFGVVATVTMIVSFAEIFADAGFQKYLVQHEFRDAKHKSDSTNVAFWTNLTIALFLWFIIIIFCEQLSIMVGNPGLGLVIAVSCVQLPIMAFSSIQMALFRREFDFETLFYIRIFNISIPFVVTIPLAIMGLSYWALIIGTICGALFNAIVLTWKSTWKPSIYYKFSLLKEMLSFSIWTTIEAISIWFTAWVDVFIIGSFLSEYYLGLYRTSTMIVGSVLAIVTAATTPILFSALSRLQNNEAAFNAMFFKTQKLVAYFVFPMGAGIYLYSDIVTNILLGSQWMEASRIIGIWALASAVMIVLSHYYSEVYRAKGRPQLSIIGQFLHLIVLLPTCILSVKYGFWVLIYARTLVRFQLLLVHVFIMKYAIKFPVGKMFANIAMPFLFTTLMCGLALGLQQFSSLLTWSLVSIIICVVFYFSMLWMFAYSDAKLIMNVFLRKKALE